MKIISWNVNGLRSAYQKGLPDFIKEEKPDIFCVQETKMQDHQFVEISAIQDYGEWHRSSAIKKGYSGVANIYKAKTEKELKGEGFAIKEEKFDSEGRFIISDLGKILLYNIYFPSGTSGEHRQSF